MKIGLLGFGTVARATLEVLQSNAHEITRRSGCALKLQAVATRSPDRAAGQLPAGCRLSDRVDDVVSATDIDVVVELMGGITTAREAIMTAMANGKHVVTANKELLARHGDELFACARSHGVMLAYEAAVAVAIPIIKILREAMAANRIEAVSGIINGTSNFILSQMRELGLSYADALAEAQRLGYAEADPAFDVNGDDAAHKLTILASLAFGIPLDLAAVQVSGIGGLHVDDIRLAETLGYRIKLLAVARRSGGGITRRVEPTLIPHAHWLAKVNGAMNAILIDANASGPTLHVGAGAGGRPTASAVIADLVDIARLLHADARHQVPLAGFRELSALVNVESTPEMDAWYVRLVVKDEVGALAAITATITAALARQSISVDVIHQEMPQNERIHLALLIHPTTQVQLQHALEQIRALNSVREEAVVLRLAR